ncbi:MAG: 30S ribosomal protein S7 [Candidatus Parvarchaeota archaeon]|nr:30S ribosomal protein S7 [Candidatus Jingweiarchaeum tengchongense]MCW1298203.1 30S ribosomal protein S7 [Candidatus Jingweiarchaeum tengchongense]MCW1300001.1 30S ribosomal protein S7 [Candidatus Jingweiarchaeum tengchongense]MCW1305009.1 30S ribosomal protein S7 [Candidatus Jingweiarchaeum tengchongense]MCW1305450.1 30S ribosomal protein S7 [Candidatus Jingweiarchaeum tengchongense]
MEIKIFNKWSVSGIKVNDPGLAAYINLKEVLIPKSHGRYEKKRFWKSKENIVERFINKITISGHKGKKHWRTSGRNVGKYYLGYKIAKSVFENIEKKTGKNPIEVLVRAIENSAPREEITVIEYAGIRAPKAVDCAPQRRVDLALRALVQGAFQKASTSRIKIVDALTEELILASNNDSKSFAISKKIETERQAAASR